jgi:sec-independent protein translocase protein TatA
MITGHLPEILIIAVVALLFLGPKRLPEAGKSIGQAIRGFRSEVSSVHEDHVTPAPMPVESDNHHTVTSLHANVDPTPPSNRPIA